MQNLPVFRHNHPPIATSPFSENPAALLWDGNNCTVRLPDTAGGRERALIIGKVNGRCSIVAVDEEGTTLAEFVI